MEDNDKISRDYAARCLINFTSACLLACLLVMQEKEELLQHFVVAAAAVVVVAIPLNHLFIHSQLQLTCRSLSIPQSSS